MPVSTLPASSKTSEWWHPDEGPDYAGCKGAGEPGRWGKKNPACDTCGNYFHCDNCGLGTTIVNEHFRANNIWSGPDQKRWQCAGHDPEYDEDGKPLGAWSNPDSDPIADLDDWARRSRRDTRVRQPIGLRPDGTVVYDDEPRPPDMITTSAPIGFKMESTSGRKADPGPSPVTSAIRKMMVTGKPDNRAVLPGPLANGTLTWDGLVMNTTVSKWLPENTIFHFEPAALPSLRMPDLLTTAEAERLARQVLGEHRR